MLLKRDYQKLPESKVFKWGFKWDFPIPQKKKKVFKWRVLSTINEKETHISIYHFRTHKETRIRLASDFPYTTLDARK